MSRGLHDRVDRAQALECKQRGFASLSKDNLGKVAHPYQALISSAIKRGCGRLPSEMVPRPSLLVSTPLCNPLPLSMGWT